MENHKHDGISRAIRHVPVSKNKTTPRDEVMAYQVGSIIYQGPPNPGEAGPGLMINTAERVITPKDAETEGALDNTIMVGFNDPTVVVETVASSLMAVLTAEQIDTVMSIVTMFMSENDRSGTLSVIHTEMREHIRMHQEVDAVDLDEIINRMLRQEEEEQ